MKLAKVKVASGLHTCTCTEHFFVQHVHISTFGHSIPRTYIFQVRLIIIIIIIFFLSGSSPGGDSQFFLQTFPVCLIPSKPVNYVFISIILLYRLFRVGIAKQA